MDWNTAFEMHREMCDRELTVRKGKAYDYSADEDVLSNFKLVPELIECFIRNHCAIDFETPWGYCFGEMLKKMARLANLAARDTRPVNESVDDTILDLRNYAELWRENWYEHLPAVEAKSDDLFDLFDECGLLEEEEDECDWGWDSFLASGDINLAY